MVDTPLQLTTSTVSSPSSTITSQPTSTVADTITATTTSSWCCRAHQPPPQAVSQWSKVYVASQESASILSEWSSLKAAAATAIVISNVTSSVTDITTAAQATTTDKASRAGSQYRRVFAEMALAGFTGLVAVYLA